MMASLSYHCFILAWFCFKLSWSISHVLVNLCLKYSTQYNILITVFSQRHFSFKSDLPHCV
jgi:hypothetical protein